MAIDLGTIGIWHAGPLRPEVASEVEELGYGAIWIGGSPPDDLGVVESVLDATHTIAVATGIVNMWSADAATVAASYQRIAGKHPGRFVLGLGVGHPEAEAAYTKPYDKIVRYLDELDEAGLARSDRLLAALGPQVLRLAAQRTAGAHPYLTTSEHTRQAREILGAGPLLAPEHKVVLDTDRERARALGRAGVKGYLGLRNYTSNLLRLGYTEEDIADGGSDRLVDDLALQGDAETIARGVRAHLDAGADHVNIQVLTNDDPLPAYRELAGAFGLP